MSTEAESRNKAILREFIQVVWNEGRLDQANRYFAEDVVDYGPEPIVGLDAFTSLIGAFRRAAPDIEWSIDKMVAEGDFVVLRWTARGTHTGSLMGIPPSGKRVVVTGFGMNRMVDGKTVEHWRSYDERGMLQQIGAVSSAKEWAA